MMSIGTAVRKLREARGWSQGQLEMHSGVRQTQLGRIERDVHRDISARNLAKIAEALEISTDYLMTEAGWLIREVDLHDPTPPERILIDTIRSVPTARVRTLLLEQFTWIAEVARDADLARQPALKLVAEDRFCPLMSFPRIIRKYPALVNRFLTPRLMISSLLTRCRMPSSVNASPLISGDQYTLTFLSRSSSSFQISSGEVFSNPV